MTILGLDIGGANIKAADDVGNACSHSFELWKHPDKLSQFLSSEIRPKFPNCRAVALTMTGELCDCYENKRDGVQHILEATQSAFHDKTLYTYSVAGDFLDPDAAKQNPLGAAASNWHALANWLRKVLDQNRPVGVLLDVGSTSTDIIPFSKEKVLAHGRTDLTRMLHGELLYTGVRRTPVSAVVSHVSLRGQRVPVAKELFATMQDVYVVTGQLKEQSQFLDTADGRGLTRTNSIRRLCRMLCADPQELDEAEIDSLAEEVIKVQFDSIAHCLQTIVKNQALNHPLFVISGSGSFMGLSIVKAIYPDHSFIWLDDLFSQSISEAAPAYAVATLLKSCLND